MSYDLHIEGVDPTTLTGGRFLTFSNDGVIIAVQGIQKMVDKFMRCLLTPAGTDISDPSYGTSLAQALVSNLGSTDLRQLIMLSVAAAEEKIQEYDTINAPPDDERLAGVEIQNLVTDEANKGIDVYLELQNVAGTTVVVLVPNYGAYLNG